MPKSKDMTGTPAGAQLVSGMIRPRIYLGPNFVVGPGKIDLLKAVRETGSISAAARQLAMSYKRAWMLLDTLKQGAGQPVVEVSQGGRGGGGARLTPLGEALVQGYESIEQACRVAARAELESLQARIQAERKT